MHNNLSVNLNSLHDIKKSKLIISGPLHIGVPFSILLPITFPNTAPVVTIDISQKSALIHWKGLLDSRNQINDSFPYLKDWNPILSNLTGLVNQLKKVGSD
jgi:hypothetical protein